MNGKWILVLSLAVVLDLVAATHSDAQRLVSAEFSSHTNNDDKDHDTGVWVTVVTNDQKRTLAQITNADNSRNDSTHYRDNTDHMIRLGITSRNDVLEQCRKFKFRVGIKAHGNDRWRFRGRVVLHFDNGETLAEDIGNSELNSRGSRYVETGWAGGS